MKCSKIVKKMAFTVSGFSEAKVMSSIGLIRLTNSLKQKVFNLLS